MRNLSFSLVAIRNVGCLDRSEGRQTGKEKEGRNISCIHLPSILLRSALWRSGFSSANFLRSTFAQTINAFIGRRIRCSLRLLWAWLLPGWHIFTPAGIGEMPCWYSKDGPEASQGTSSSRCCAAGPLSMPGIWFQEIAFHETFRLARRAAYLSPRRRRFAFTSEIE